ncbi:MAG: hypothetical protein WCO63_00075 [Bacteroidota bacterium]
MNKILNREDCFLYGHIRKALGFHGAVKIVLENDLPLQQDDIDFFFLDLEDGLIPFHVEELTGLSGLSLEVKFTDVLNIASTGGLLNIPVYLPKSFRSTEAEDENEEDAWLGFQVKDKTLGLLGILNGFVHFREQSLLKVTKDKNEILIPLVPEIIKKVDMQKKTILVDLPEGLVDLNA